MLGLMDPGVVGRVKLEGGESKRDVAIVRGLGGVGLSF